MILPTNIFQVGDNHTLMCSVSGADKLDPNISYKWTESDGNQVKSTSQELSLHILSLSEAGNYKCSVTVTSSYLDRLINESATQDVIIKSKSFPSFL